MFKAGLTQKPKGLVDADKRVENFQQPVIAEFFDAKMRPGLQPCPEKKRVNRLADDVEKITVAVTPLVVLVKQLLGVEVG